MGIFDELKRMAHPFEDDDEEFEEYEAAAPRAAERRDRGIDRYERPERVERVSRSSNSDNYDVIGMESERRSNKVVNIRAATQLQVVLVKPEKFDDASAIADHLREKRTVVLNLESTNKEIARRLLDFLSGVAYANEGKIKKVAISTYIITPYNVDILGDLIDELENNGLYF